MTELDILKKLGDNYDGDWLPFFWQGTPTASYAGASPVDLEDNAKVIIGIFGTDVAADATLDGTLTGLDLSGNELFFGNVNGTRSGDFFKKFSFIATSLNGSNLQKGQYVIGMYKKLKA